LGEKKYAVNFSNTAIHVQYLQNIMMLIRAYHFPKSCIYIESTACCFPLPVHAPLIFILIPQSTLSLSLRLVLPAPIATYSSYFIIIVYLVLSFYLLYSSNGLSTGVCHIKMNIYTPIAISCLHAHFTDANSCSN